MSKKKRNKGKKMRPNIPIDWKKVDYFLEGGCLGTEIAAYFAMHPNTFYDRVLEHTGLSFTEYSQQKRSKGDGLLRLKQCEKALKGDNTMLLWLGKNRLGQRDRFDDEHIPNKKEINNLIDAVKSAYKTDDFKDAIKDRIETYKQEQRDDIELQADKSD